MGKQLDLNSNELEFIIYKNKGHKKLSYTDDIQNILKTEITDIRYIVALLLNPTDQTQTTSTLDKVKNVIRKQYECRCPVVFITNRTLNNFLQTSIGQDEFFRTYGLGQFLYSIPDQRFLLPDTNRTSNSAQTASTPNIQNLPLTEDDLKKISERMRTELPLSDLKMAHLRMYYDPAGIVARLRHDGQNAKDPKPYQKKLNKLAEENNINLTAAPEEFVGRCNFVEKKLKSERLTNTNTTPIHVLLLEDNCDTNDMKTFIKYAKKQHITIKPVKTVEDALAEINGKTRYTVILVDLLLKEKHSVSDVTTNPDEPDIDKLINTQQGYDFIEELASMEHQYGIIILSTLPRNFKTEISGQMHMRTRSFPYKDSGRLQKSEYQQMLIDMIVEAHNELSEDAAIRAFTERGYAMHYIRYTNKHRGAKEIDTDARDIIKDFLKSVDGNKKNWGKKDDPDKDLKDCLTGLSSEIAPVLNEVKINEEVSSFLRNLYDWSWEKYCELKCPSTPPEDNINEITKYCKKECIKEYKGKKYTRNDKSIAIKIESAINEGGDEIIKDFIQKCYSSPLSLETTLNLYKQTDKIKDFVKRLLTYNILKNYPDDDTLKKRFVARRVALFILLWANLSKKAHDEYINNKSGKKLTALNCANQIMAQYGWDPGDYKSSCNILNPRLWIKEIKYTKERQKSCSYMTREEEEFFVKLFKDKNNVSKAVQFELYTESTNSLNTMSIELIYHFK